MAFISQELINEIKSKNDIVDVISGYINLNEKNKALCPFHNDHSPSFSVNGDKQIYKCFGCGQGGTVIQFVSKLENLDFRETLETLAERANIDLEKYKVFSMICYLVMGWCIIFKINVIFNCLGIIGFSLLLLGGIAYTLGAVAYVVGRKRKWMHSIFHIACIIGSILHFLCILLFVI